MTNIFTTSTGDYNSFIPLFLLSHLFYNDDCLVEIHAENYAQDLTLLEELFPYQFNIFSLDRRKGVSNNSLRFLTQPNYKTDYIYISDIDIVCMESITDKHKSNTDLDRDWETILN